MNSQKRKQIMKCTICGRFISFKDLLDRRKVLWRFVIDYHWENDVFGYYPVETCLPDHVKCINKEQKKIKPFNQLIMEFKNEERISNSK